PMVSAGLYARTQKSKISPDMPGTIEYHVGNIIIFLHFGQRTVISEQMLLSDDVGEALRSDPVCQRLLAHIIPPSKKLYIFIRIMSILLHFFKIKIEKRLQTNKQCDIIKIQK
ncbi:MAG: hypothetical protein IKL40_04240, partial [Clostridia bacterium]|nr:hypothetical protein [Clostridia bacterium]